MEQRFSKTKFDDNGQPKPYFSHMANGQMCFGRPDKKGSSAPNSKPHTQGANTDTMLACNALNNTIALANAGTIKVEQIEATYKKLLRILTGQSTQEKKEDLDSWAGTDTWPQDSR